jgi:hypothetical protein
MKAKVPELILRGRSWRVPSHAITHLDRAIEETKTIAVIVDLQLAGARRNQRMRRPWCRLGVTVRRRDY